MHQSGARFLCMVAGTRGGKTMAGLAEFARRVMVDAATGKGRPVVGRGKDRRAALHYWIVSPTYPLSKESRRYAMEMFPPELMENPDRPINSENQMWLRVAGGTLIEWRSADRPFSLVSVGLNGMLLDEAARIPAEAWLGNLRGRLSDKRGWCLFASTPLGRNWLFHEVVERGLGGAKQDPEYRAFVWHTADNPHIPAEEIDSARRTLPIAYFRREYEADFSAFSGGVFPEWDEAVHVFDERPDPFAFRRAIIAVDFGWNAPGAALAIGDYGGRFDVVEEVYKPQMVFHDPRLSTGTWLTEIRRLSETWRGANPSCRVFCDPSRPDLIHELVRNGINATGADNDVLWGIRQVATAMHPVHRRPALRVHRSCENLRREIPLYVWGVTKTGEFTEYPADGLSDHSVDGLRYGILELTRHQQIASDAPPRRGPERVLGVF